MKSIAIALIVTASLASPLAAAAQEPAKTLTVKRSHALWLGDGLNRLALLLPTNRHGAASDQVSARK